MHDISDMPDSPLLPGEEIANSVSHGIALLAAVVSLPILIASTVRQGDLSEIVGASIFAGAVVFLYFVSTLYHALPVSRVKRMFRLLDHNAIYLLIAGTYTPFTLGVLRGVWGWTLFGLVWGMALVGVVLKMTTGHRYERLSLALYLLMGWIAVIAIKPIWLLLPAWGVTWLVAGGVAYTVGVLFYLAGGLRYHHLVWHLFVVAGTTCHFIAVGCYAGYQ